jgi:hypothetical protein
MTRLPVGDTGPRRHRDPLLLTAIELGSRIRSPDRFQSNFVRLPDRDAHASIRRRTGLEGQVGPSISIDFF